MSVLFSEDHTELIVSCMCGCDDMIHIKIDNDEKYDCIAFVTYLNSNWYREQEDTVWGVIKRKLQKIWRIIRGKDHYYSEILMNRDDFNVFKEYINQI